MVTYFKIVIWRQIGEEMRCGSRCYNTPKMRIGFLSFVFILCLALSVLGCDRQGTSGDELKNSVMTSAFNYTDYDFINIYYQDATAPPNILRSSAGGSAYVREGSTTKLDSGVTVHSEQSICCFKWDAKRSVNVVLRVKWLAVFDRAKYERAVVRTDERSLKESLPGSQWCEALVTLTKPYPEDPDMISVHFLPDGSLQAYAGKYGQEYVIGPLKAGTVLAHTPSSGAVVCKTPTSNPLYKIPRAPHRE